MSNVGNMAKKVALTTWEGIWYVLMNIAFGAAYFTKVPVKKALQDFGLVQMTSADTSSGMYCSASSSGLDTLRRSPPRRRCLSFHNSTPIGRQVWARLPRSHSSHRRLRVLLGHKTFPPSNWQNLQSSPRGGMVPVTKRRNPPGRTDPWARQV